MKILSIETSCDETAAAVVKDGTTILSNVVTSSIELHNNSGGIIPEVAAREQVKCIIPVLEQALKSINNETIQQFNNGESTDKSKKGFKSYFNKLIQEKIDAIAVTIGPGLIGSLLVGVETAKTLSFMTGKPLIPVNHIFAHIYANWLDVEKEPEFPAIALVVSGGHTELFYLKGHGKIKWIGGTLDDAAGECFDKTARLLGLGFPGGPAIATEAVKFEIRSASWRTKFEIKLPRPMMGQDNLNFSFSGLKTAVLREVNKLKTTKSRRNGIHDAVMRKNLQTASGQFNSSTIQQLSYEIQESITDVLVDKTLKAAQKHQVKSILLGGGVAANKRLTEKFISHLSSPISHLQLHIPPPKLCTDNAAYIGSYAYFHNNPLNWRRVQARPDLEVEV